MGEPTPHPPVLLLLAAFSRYDEALDWAKRGQSRPGGRARESPRFDFSETDYYDATMGTGLKKVFFAFQRPSTPSGSWKSSWPDNRWEEQYAADGRELPEPRP